MNEIDLKSEILNSTILETIVLEIYQLAKEAGIKRIALVGGAIRDNMLNKRKNRIKNNPKDIDIIVEGSAIDLAKKLSSSLKEGRVSKLKLYKVFNTAEIKIDNYIIDLTSAREETYPSPGGIPNFVLSTIEIDLKRRDFTINSMALEIPSFKIIDSFKGKESLLKDELTFLHKKSVADDPTRIFRGARYAAKLNFHLDKKSIKQIRRTIKEWPWDWSHQTLESTAPISLSTRLKLELQLLFKEKNWRKGLDLLKDWDALSLIDEKIQNERFLKERINNAFKLNLDPLTALIAGSKNPLELSKRFEIDQTQKEILIQAILFKEMFESLLKNDNRLQWKPSQWCARIEEGKWKNEAIAIVISLKVDYWEILIKWWTNWRHIKPPISGEEMIAKGWVEGPELGEELKRLRYIQINKNASAESSNLI